MVGLGKEDTKNEKAFCNRIVDKDSEWVTWVFDED